MANAVIHSFCEFQECDLHTALFVIYVCHNKHSLKV